MVTAGVILLAAVAGVVWLMALVFNYWMPVLNLLHRVKILREEPHYVSFVPIVGTMFGCAFVSVLRLRFTEIPELTYWLVLIPEIPVAAALLRVAISGFEE